MQPPKLAACSRFCRAACYYSTQRPDYLQLFSRLLCLAAAVTTLSCGRLPQTAQAEPARAAIFEAAPPDRYADDVGRFLAGLPAAPESSLAELHATEAWRRHRLALDPAWSRFETQALEPMRAFQKEQLAPAIPPEALVFYPFSGPDALIVTTFFPRSPVYVMVGLEPAGTLPSPAQLRRENLEAHLAAVRATTASELGRSFFVTRQMDRQFRGQVTDGLFQPLVELLVRTNHTILGYRYIRLDEAGRITGRAADYHAPGKIGNKGVEIDFKAEDGSVHKLIYLSVNLSDSRLHEDQAFLTFVSSLKNNTTFLKATSYMMHKSEFSIIRDRILATSAAVLQDDSGIPYRYFAADQWRVQLYGDYVRPYGSFRWLEQKDLRTAYKTSGAKGLGFRIGYGYGRIPSNLLLATRP
jgi:hypothetical protein